MRVLALGVAVLLLGACSGDAASVTTSLGVTPGSIGVVVGGVRWEIPAAACTQSPGDGSAVAIEAASAASHVTDLVALRASGWPTTTAAPPGDAATFFVAVNRSGPTALALGLIAGTAAEIEAAWVAFELGYAGDGWGPVTDISVRLPGWRTTASAIAGAIPAACG